MASSTMVIKVKHGDTLRRFNAHVDENDQPDMDIGALRFKICGLFNFKLDEDITMTYVDEDGDVVTLVNDEDLRDALNQNMKFLRIDVHKKIVEAEKSDAKTTGGSTPVRQHKFCFETLSQLPVPSYAKMGLPSPLQPVSISDVRNFFSKAPSAKSDSKSESIVNESSSKNSHTMEVQNVTKDVGISAPSKNTSVDLNVVPADSNPSKPAFPSVSQVRQSHLIMEALMEAHKVFNNFAKGNSTVKNPALIGSHLPNPFKKLHPEVSCSMFHTGVRCDGCGCHPIVGSRFKSVVKEDYDLCRICHSSMSNVSEFTRIDHPESYRHPRPSNGVPHKQPPLTSLPALSKMSHLPPPPSMQFGVRLERPNKLDTRFGLDVNVKDGTLIPPSNISHVSSPPLLQSGVKLERPNKLDSRFVLDVNVKDGTLMPPYTSFTKVWRMGNNGGLIWPKGTQLTWIGGDKFSKSDSVEIENPANGVSPENEVDIAVDFTAPGSPGRYISYWRMASPSGQKFGQRVWVLIQVDASLKHPLFGWNFNRPPNEIFNFPQQNVSSDSSAESSSSNSVEEVAIPILDEKHENEQDLNFPINNSLLVGDTPSVDTSEPATPSATRSAVGTTPISSEESISDNAVKDTLLKELEEMGFKQVDLNKEILRRNEYDLEKSVDDLCDATEWDPILEELQEMGFSDVEMNKKLLEKNNGSIKQVVMDLINGDEH